MNEDFVSVLDMLETGTGERAVRDEVLEMDLAVKRHMDAGLTPDDMVTAQRVRGATQAAARALDRLFA